MKSAANTPKTGTLNSRGSRERDASSGGLHDTSVSSGSRTLNVSQENVLSASGIREPEQYDDSSQSGSRSISSPKKDHRGISQQEMANYHDGSELDEEMREHVEMAHKGAPDNFNYSFYKISYDSSTAAHNANDNDDSSKFNDIKEESEPVEEYSSAGSAGPESDSQPLNKSGSSELLPQYPDVPDTELFIDEEKLNNEIKQDKQKEIENEAQRLENLEKLALEYETQRKLRSPSTEISPTKGSEIGILDQNEQDSEQNNNLSLTSHPKVKKQERVDSCDDNDAMGTAPVVSKVGSEFKIQNTDPESCVQHDVVNGDILESVNGVKKHDEISYVLKRRVCTERDESPNRKGFNIPITSNVALGTSRSPRLTKEQRKVHLEKVKTDLVSPIEPPAKSPKSPRDRSPRRPMELVTYNRLPPMNSYSSLDDTVSPSSFEKEIFGHFKTRSKSYDSEKELDSSFEEVKKLRPSECEVSSEITDEQYREFAENVVSSIIASVCTGKFSKYLSEEKQRPISPVQSVETEKCVKGVTFEKNINLADQKKEENGHSNSESDDLNASLDQTEEDLNVVLSEFAPDEVSSVESVSSAEDDNRIRIETAAEEHAEKVLENMAYAEKKEYELNLSADVFNENADKSLDELEALEHLPPTPDEGIEDGEDLFIDEKMNNRPPFQFTLSSDELIGATALPLGAYEKEHLFPPGHEQTNVRRSHSPHSSISSEANVEHPDMEDVHIFDDQLVPPGTNRLASPQTHHRSYDSFSSEENYEQQEGLGYEAKAFPSYSSSDEPHIYAQKHTPDSSSSSNSVPCEHQQSHDVFFSLDQNLLTCGTATVAQTQPKLEAHSSISSDGSAEHPYDEYDHCEALNLLPPGTFALAKPVPKLTPHSSISSDGSVEHPDAMLLTEDMTLLPPGTIAMAKPQPKLTPHSSISSDGSTQSPCREDLHLSEDQLLPPPGTSRISEPIPKLTPHSSISSDGSVEHPEMGEVHLMEEQLLPPPGTLPLAHPHPEFDSSGSSSPKDENNPVSADLLENDFQHSPNDLARTNSSGTESVSRHSDVQVWSNLAVFTSSSSRKTAGGFPPPPDHTLLQKQDYQSSSSDEDNTQDDEQDEYNYVTTTHDFSNPFFLGGYGSNPGVPDVEGHEQTVQEEELHSQYYLDGQALDAHFAPVEAGFHNFGNGQIDVFAADLSGTDSTFSDSFELLDQESNEDLLEDNLEQNLEAIGSGHSDVDSSDGECIGTVALAGEPDIESANMSSDNPEAYNPMNFDPHPSEGDFFSNPFAQSHDQNLDTSDESGLR